MTVGILELKPNRGRGVRGATGDFRGLELDPIRKLNADTMLGSRSGASDRAGRGFKHAGYRDTRCSTLDIRVKLDRFEERWVHGRGHHPIDPPVSRPLVGLAPVQHCSHSFSLPAIGPLVNDALKLAVALVDRSGPRVKNGSAQAVERHVSKVAPINPNGREPATVSVRRPA